MIREQPKSLLVQAVDGSRQSCVLTHGKHEKGVTKRSSFKSNDTHHWQTGQEPNVADNGEIG